MALKYTDIKDLAVQCEFPLSGERCKWYNDDKIPGYQVGAAVWLGTEDPEQFVKSRFDEIEHTVLNSQYRGEYIQISSQTDKVMEMFLNICNGENGYKRLYYLGDITQHAQVRVCISATDPNTNTNYDLPSENTWRDSFRLSSEQDYKEIML